ncbi:MAG: AgmX/PglI C-terminal domain-containing protein [Polyangiales bacterium]
MSHDTAAPTGAMTRAMRAGTTSTSADALRVAVMQGTRVLDERLFRGDARVSLGRGERATFVVDSPALPERLELFTVRGEERTAHLDPSIRGRLSNGVETRAASAWAPSSGALRIDPRWRGRLEIGEVVVLFQFVCAAPVSPRAQLPAAIRARPLGALDWTWNACAAAFLALGLAGASYAEYIYDPVVDDEPEQILRMVRLMAPEAATPRDRESAEPASPDRDQAAASAPDRPDRDANARVATAQPARPRSERARVADAVAAANRAAEAAMGELRGSSFSALVGALEQGNGSARDQLAQGAMQQASLEALRDTHGVSVEGRGRIAARADGDPAARRSLCGEDCMAQRTVRPSAPEIASTTVVRERRISPMTVPVEPPIDGVGEVDPAAVASRIRGQLGGVRSCYERALRANPDLRGRLEVRFTLGETGRITRIQASGMSQSPEVGACVSQRLRALAFPPPRGGSVDFLFPFVLDHQ